MRLTIYAVELASHFAVWAVSPEAKFLPEKFIWVNWDVDELKANAKVIENTSVLSLELGGFLLFKQ